MPSSGEWGLYYQQAFMDNGQAMPISGGFSDATVVTTSSSTVAADSISSPSSSYNGGQLTPTGSVSKPIRRRSRVSKKTPITLLNANANNFRALVQQFTGCANPNTALPFGNQKGPITLSFGANNVSNSVMAPFVNHDYNYHHYQPLQRLAQPQIPVRVQEQEQQRQPLLQLQENQQFHQAQQHTYLFDNVSGSTHDVLHSSTSDDYYPMPSTEVVSGFAMDQEDIVFHEISRNLFSN